MAEPRAPDWYRGEDLDQRPHVIVIFRDQIGDFVVATPLMRGLRERFPNLVLDYLGGERTRELEEASPLIDARYSLYGGEASLEGLCSFLDERRRAAGPYSLAVNLEADDSAARACGLAGARYVVGGYVDPVSGERRPFPQSGVERLWSDPRWNRADLVDDYPVLSSQFIGELFCRLAHVETDYFRAEVPVLPPRIATPPVLLSTGGNRSAKLWPTVYWEFAARTLCSRGYRLGLLGAPPGLQRSAYHAEDVDQLLVERGVVDLRGRLTLPEVAGALQNAQVLITVDNGLMHLGAAVGTPTVALVGASPLRLWSPRRANVQLLGPEAPCSLCEENRFRNEACLLPVHQCMLSISPRRVLAEVERLIAWQAA